MRIIGSERMINFNTLKERNNFIQSLTENMHYYTFSSGRNAIYNLFKHFKKQNILFPDFFCPSMLTPLKKNKNRVQYYKINSHFTAVKSGLEHAVDYSDIVFIVDYFGQRDHYLYELAHLKGKIIVIDRTHSLLCHYEDRGHYEIASFRKLFPVPDGGILISNKQFDFGNKRDYENYSFAKTYSKLLRFIYERYSPTDVIEDYYVNYSESSEDSMQLGNYDISPLSMHIVNHYPIEYAKQMRINNYRYLDENLPFIAALRKPPPVPQSFPFYIKRRDKIKKLLQNMNIYIPVLWRNSKSYSKHLLNIPIDDEYSINDMKQIIKDISKVYASTQ